MRSVSYSTSLIMEWSLETNVSFASTLLAVSTPDFGDCRAENARGRCECDQLRSSRLRLCWVRTPADLCLRFGMALRRMESCERGLLSW